MLHKLQIQHFRNLSQAEIYPSDGMNLLLGLNGSGKSSVLEAIHYLSLGRSFRTHLTNRVIMQGEKAFTLFAQLQLDDQSVSVGLQKDRQGDTQLKIGGKNADKLAQLASLLPLQLIHPEGYNLLTGGPQQRRAFVDWGVFHAEQAFFPLWGKVRRLLKQRNALLRQSAQYAPLAYWDQLLVECSQALSVFRQQYCQALLPLVQQICQELLPEYTFQATFYAGWQQEQDLSLLLQENFERDRQLGHTAIGPHRADLRLRAEGVPVQDLLSRGQLKLLVCALRLAQGLYLRQHSEKTCLFLIDDFASELDAEKRYVLAKRLQQCESQVFITAIDQQPLQGMMQEFDCRLFHVKQGNITE
ncbi:DNA replication/repair protein RecF [Tolumonas lignilytica]|uniref:DNA replication/repair protein RecF n=1 Tax=Tolumonas lignilytica TaxID=1283284 RepID=UPI000463014F|nr:DNA replication/repair protein RecF [Tolumonas lignilytica]